MLPAQSSSCTGTEHFLGLVPLRGGTHLCVTGCLAARGALPAAPGRASPHSHDHPVITRHQHRTHGTVPNVGRTTELQETQPALITPNTQPKPTPSSRTAHYKCPPPTPPRVLVNAPLPSQVLQRPRWTRQCVKDNQETGTPHRSSPSHSAWPGDLHQHVHVALPLLQHLTHVRDPERGDGGVVQVQVSQVRPPKNRVPEGHAISKV